jgi:hypothetical protein
MGTFTRSVRFTAAVRAVSGVILFLLLVFVFGGGLKNRQSLVPKVCKVVAQEGDALGIQFVDAARAVAAVAHKVGLLQDAQVLRDGRPGYGQAGGQFVHRAGVGAQHLEDGQAGRVAEGGESVLYVSIHLR